MIAVLRVQNLAIVESLEVEFGAGMNAITGETGAGKSMLVKALELLRGGRAAPALVRTGEKQAVVEALLEVDGTERVIRRVVTAAGRSRAYIDGELSTVAGLRQLASQWLDISSQHEHQTLTDPSGHLEWLDRFAGNAERRESLGGLVDQARQAATAIRNFRNRLDQREDRVDLVRFQLAEIDNVAPKPGELDEVLTELDRLQHADAIQANLAGAAAALHHGDRTGAERVSRAIEQVRSAARRDSTLDSIVERLDGVRLELEDLADELSQRSNRLEVDPHRLAQLTQRERALSRLVRRHGDLEAAIARATSLREELEGLGDADSTLEQLGRAADVALSEAGRVASALSADRRSHADALAAAITTELDALGMGTARIQVAVDALPPEATALTVDGARLSPTGIDQVEFLIAPNPGEAPRPLAEIASGGELSRALLALKQVLAGLGPVGTYVFDEVDTGVGGAVADAIGQKLATVAKHHQVLVITHQAVIAGWADQHIHVSKAVTDGRTRSSVAVLTLDERREELARMLGGAEVTAGVRAAASELLRVPA